MPNNTEKFSKLNPLGCSEQLTTRLDQIEGVIGALLNGDDLSEHLLRACLENVFSLTNESKELAKLQYSFLPRSK